MQLKDAATEQFGLNSILPCDPTRPTKAHPQISDAIDQWFDVVCYGRET